jgi:outer membrane protein insertion porin family
VFDGGWIFSTSVEGGYMHSFEETDDPTRDPVRLTDRFFLGEPQLRGFDIRGVGPRVVRRRFNADGTLDLTKDGIIAEDAIGGRAYYLGRAELQIPLGASIRELGLRPSVFVDVGALFKIRDPGLTDVLPNDPRTQNRCVDASGGSTPVPTTGICPTGTTLTFGIAPFDEEFLGDTPKPRVSVGFGVNWNSPFGPFRIDVAKALITAEGDDTKLITFNVGTAF